MDLATFVQEYWALIVIAVISGIAIYSLGWCAYKDME